MSGGGGTVADTNPEAHGGPLMLKPRMPAPIPDVPLVDGHEWRLAEQNPGAFTLVVLYRGYHCPVCKSHLRELERLLDDFAALGVVCMAVSGDTEQRARQSVEEWGITRLAVGYDQSVESMRAWASSLARPQRQRARAIRRAGYLPDPFGRYRLRRDSQFDALRPTPARRTGEIHRLDRKERLPGTRRGMTSTIDHACGI